MKKIFSTAYFIVSLPAFLCQIAYELFVSMDEYPVRFKGWWIYLILGAVLWIALYFLIFGVK